MREQEEVIGVGWRDAALCRQYDPELFFPVGNTGRAVRRQVADAKRVCNGAATTPPCPVKRQCLSWALSTGQRYGVWGGMSEDERREVRRRAAAKQNSPQPVSTRGRSA